MKWEVNILIDKVITIKAKEIETMEEANIIAKHYQEKVTKIKYKKYKTKWNDYKNYSKNQPALATDKQKSFLTANNLKFSHRISASEASELITAIIKEKRKK